MLLYSCWSWQPISSFYYDFWDPCIIIFGEIVASSIYSVNIDLEFLNLGKDDDGQPLSITHFKIKNAQEKFMLQQQGDDLDQKIKIAEKEIVAIENTLKMVNLTNVAFKSNLSELKDDGK